MHAAVMSLEVPARILGHNATEVYGLNGSHLTTFWWSKSCDFLYVPERLRMDYIGVSMTFVGHDIFVEAANAHMIGLLIDGNHTNYEVFAGRWLWGRDRANATLWGLRQSGLADKMAWMHPVKLSHSRQMVIRWWEGLTCPSRHTPNLSDDEKSVAAR